MPFARQRLEEQEQIAHPFAFTLVVLTQRAPWLHRQGLPHIHQELLRGLIHTDQWPPGVIGTPVNLKHLLHLAYKSRIRLRGNTVLLLEPGFQFVFSHLTDGLVGDLFHIARLHEAIAQQTQAPAGVAFWRLATGQCDQMRFGFPVQNGGRIRAPASCDSRRLPGHLHSRPCAQ